MILALAPDILNSLCLWFRWIDFIKVFWCLSITGWAVFTDISYHKIKNKTVLAGLSGGLILNVISHNLQNSLIGAAVPLVLFLLFIIGYMGAGDVKLLCAIGAIIGFPSIIKVVLYSFVFCGVYILIDTARCRGIGILFHDLWEDFKYLVLSGSFLVSREKRRFPMAVPIFLAVLLWVVSGLVSRVSGK